MAHWAELDENNIVLRVVVTNNDDLNGDEGYQWLIDNLNGIWVQTSYNTRLGVHTDGGTPFRKNYAGIGYIYDELRDAFIPPKPEEYPSWILNEETCAWEPPIEKPYNDQDDSYYEWDEKTVSWILVPIETEK